MLTLVSTVLVAVYLLGPDLVSRWILGFAVTRKALVQSKAEEITRAILWAAVPLASAVLWARYLGRLAACARPSDLKLFFSGLYSTPVFERSPDAWFASAKALAWWNYCVLWRLYALIILAAVALNLLILNYGRLRRRLPHPWQKSLLATLVLPRVSEWHILLSTMLLPSRDLRLHADILTKNGTLYQGMVTDKVLNSDGSIQSLTLTEPKRLLPHAHRDDDSADSLRQKERVWRDVPGNLFLILGTDISNVNLRYRPAMKPGSPGEQLLRSLVGAQARPAKLTKQANKIS